MDSPLIYQTVFFLIFPVSVLAQGLTPGRYEPKQLPPELHSYLTYRMGLSEKIPDDGADLKKIIALSEEPIEELSVESKKEMLQKKQFWLGSKIKASTTMDVELNWASKDPEKPGMSTYINFEPKGILVRLSHPFSQSYLGGFRISLRADTRTIFFLEGSQRRSFILIMPPIEEPGVRAVALCPRHFQEHGNEYEVTVLEATDYAVQSAKFSAAANSSGSFTTVGFSAYARSAILVGFGLNPSLPFEDVARSTDPSVTISYHPKEEPTAVPVAEKINGGVLSGIQATTKLVGPAGQVRNLSHENKIEIRGVSMDARDSISIKGVHHIVAPGSCVLITRLEATTDRFQ